ncbi:flavin monoamine oxidase family protein [Thalassotalea montiporae]
MSCKSPQVAKFKGKVIIIGAGVAGLTAGYLLQQQGIDFEILEASSIVGGRVKTNKDFVDFPIPLGAEWIHAGKNVLAEIVNTPNATIDVPTLAYNPNTDNALHEGEQISIKDAGFSGDLKFINNTWLTFYETYVLPSISNKITYQQVAQHINYSGQKVVVDTQNGQHIADKVIVTVPVKILQAGDIGFTPPLPTSKQQAINEVTVWDGFKAFIEFSEKFYPTLYSFDIEPEADGQKLYYDAAYGQNSERHVLGLFTVGKPAETLGKLSHAELQNKLLTELDQIFDGQASSHFKQLTSQHWGQEPYAKGGYIHDQEHWRNITRLAKSVGDKLYFAGDGYGFMSDWSSVHVAVRSAKRAVNTLF